MAVRIAVVGMGIGRAHLAALKNRVDNADIAAVCDIRRAAAEEQAAAYGTQAFDDVTEMLDAVKPEGVILATPPAVHAEHTVIAAERGIHVLVEKPMAPNVADCERMIQACAKANVTLMIAFKKRFFPCFRFIRDQVAESGAPLLWANVRFALGRVEKDWFWDEDNGGGPLLENVIHEFDILRFLMGEVTQTYAVGGNLFMPDRAPQIDAAGVVLTLANGGVASMGVGYGSEWPMAKEELALASEKLVFELQGAFDHTDALRYCHRDDPGNIKTPAFEPLGDGAAFAHQLRHFVDCIAGRADCESTGEDGLAAVRLALATKQSIREKRPLEVGST